MVTNTLVQVSLFRPLQFFIFLKKMPAGPPGLEPGTLVLETRILPLNYRPLWEEYSTFLVDKKCMRVKNAPIENQPFFVYATGYCLRG